MKRLFLLCATLFFCLFMTTGMAQQSGGGDMGLDEVCRLAGGTWTGSKDGNWACCWDNWGCYGCHNGNCKMQCRTQRCRRANGMAHAKKGQQRVKGLAPAGTKAPIAPIPQNPPTHNKVNSN